MTARLRLIRLIFTAFSLASALLLLVLLLVAAATDRPLAYVAAGLLAVLAWKWVAEYRGRSAGIAADLLEAAALFVVAAADRNAISILILLYARISSRALDTSSRHLAVVTGAYAAAFFAAVSVTSPHWGFALQSIPDVILASGFALAPAVMHLLADTMARLTAARATERELQAAMLQQSEENFRQVFDGNPQPLWLHDPSSGRFLAVNDAALQQYGYSRAEFLEMDVRVLAENIEDPDTTEHRAKDGTMLHVQADVSRIWFRSSEAVLVIARDVGEQRRLQQRLEHNALHDPLTGLANQVLLRQRVSEALARLELNGDSGPAVLVLDLDGFKTVNDTMGHAIGDRVLAIVAARIARCIKGRDTAARLGGDEFAVLLDMVHGADNAVGVAERIIREIGRPIHLRGRTLDVNASCGVAVPRAEGRTPEELVSDADLAMYAAKGRGPGRVALFDPALRAALLQRISLEQDLSAALARDELRVVYQPQVDLTTGRVVAVEALLRWQHPDRGNIPPDQFIPLAEQLGIVGAIDEWVLRTSLHTLRQWTDAGLHDLRLGVNLSGADLARDDLAASVRSALLASMIDPWRLELELTETTALASPRIAIARLLDLRAMGVRIAIDDFGTGFSMLISLRDLPIDRLKIDRSFVMDLDRDDDARAIVGSTIAMGHSLGLDLCAEGVESEASAVLLRDLGCDHAQGYHFSRPLPPDEFLDWVRRHTPPPVRLTPEVHRRGSAARAS